MTELLAKQFLFSRLQPQLVDYIHNVMHLECVLKEVHRPPEMAAIYKKRGVGEDPSIHEDDLAIDIVLFTKEAEPIWDVKVYEPAGRFWEGLSPDCRWGGDFTRRKDGVHFSITHGGLS